MQEFAEKEYGTKNRIYDLMRIKLADHPSEIQDVQFAFMISKTILEILLSEPEKMEENISHFLRFSAQACPMTENAIAASEKGYTKVDVTNCPTEEEIEKYSMPFVQKPIAKEKDSYYALCQMLVTNYSIHADTVIQANPGYTEKDVMEMRIQKSAELIMSFFQNEPDTNMHIGLVQTLLYAPILYGFNLLPFASVYKNDGYVWPKEELTSFIKESGIDEEIFTKIEGFYKDFSLSESRIADLLPDSISFALKTVAAKYPDWETFIHTPAFKELFSSITTIFHFHAKRLGKEFDYMKSRLFKDIKQYVEQEYAENFRKTIAEEVGKGTKIFNYNFMLKSVEQNPHMEDAVKEFGESDPILKAMFEEWKENQTRKETVAVEETPDWVKDKWKK